MAQYAARPEHAEVEAMGRMMGVPDSGVETVACVDCGKRQMAAHCSWRINRKTLDWTGPHCGCTQNVKAIVNCMVDRIMASSPCPPLDELGLTCLLDERLLAGKPKGYACRDCWRAAIWALGRCALKSNAESEAEDE